MSSAYRLDRASPQQHNASSDEPSTRRTASPRTGADAAYGRAAIVLWFACLLFALATVGTPSVERTQEGRVLETARQMLDAGPHGWLIPHLNGELRLQKPPLAYWLAAVAFNLFGVSAGAGRVPFVLAAWLTAGLTYHIGKHLFGTRAGLFAMAATFGCLSTARYGMLAETDVLATLFVTAAIYANWRGVRACATDEPWSRPASWFHAGAAATAFAILSKGLPGAFPILFLIAFALTGGAWRTLARWCASLAPFTLIAIALPWFAYVMHAVGHDTFAFEILVAAEGKGHRGSFLSYAVYIVLDSAPWSGVTLLALWACGTRVRRDPRLRGVGCWLLVILVPLCLAGQKQRHYLVPLVPALMLVTGWFLDRGLRVARRAAWSRALGAVLLGTGGALTLAALAAPIVGRIVRGSTIAADVLVCVALAGVGGCVLAACRRRAPTLATYALLAVAPIVPAIHNGWASTLRTTTPRSIADELRRDYGGRAVQFVGVDDLPLMFHIRARTVAPPLRTLQPLVIEARDDAAAPTPVPGTRLLRWYVDRTDLVVVCEEEPAVGAPATEAASGPIDRSTKP